MTTRPSQKWRRKAREQAAALAAGTLTADEAYAEQLWPEAFSLAVDDVLVAYEAEVRALSTPSDEEVFAAVARVVLALNAIDAEHGRIETGEREELCDHVDRVLVGAGIDVDGLAARRGIGRAELTDGWRDW